MRRPQSGHQLWEVKDRVRIYVHSQKTSQITEEGHHKCNHEQTLAEQGRVEAIFRVLSNPKEDAEDIRSE